MDIIKIGTDLLMKQLGSSTSANSSVISSALGGLLSGSDGKLDIGGLVAKFASNGALSSIVGSWLGDGDNNPIGSDAVESVLGGDKISDFAGKLGIDKSTAMSSLSSIIPSLIDKSSSGGKLMDSAGGLLGMAKKFF